MKTLFDENTGGKNRLARITGLFSKEHTCCSLTWDKCLALATQYHSLTKQGITREYLKLFIKEQFGQGIDGSKDVLQHIALSGIQRFVFPFNIHQFGEDRTEIPASHKLSQSGKIRGL
jgi:hypothetical protein